MWMIKENSNINFKLELIKNGKNLNINIHLNQNAQNINLDEHTISWSPTKEELSFLSDVSQLLKHQEINNTLIFHKKYQEDNEVNKCDFKESVDDAVENPNQEDQWESINQVINNKLKENH
jgi:archaellin